MSNLQIIGLLLMLGAIAVLGIALDMRRKEQVEVRRHLDLVATVSGASGTTAARVRAKWHTLVNERLRRIFTVGVTYVWGMHSGALFVLTVAAGSGAFTWIIADHTFGHTQWLAASLSAVAFFLVPRIILIRQQRNAERQFMALFPNGIDMMVRMLRAGLPISTTVRTIQTDSPPPLSTVFGSLADQVTLGVPFEKALETASDRIGLPDFRFLAVALNIQHATGGNLAATLEILSDLIKKRRALRLKAAAATAEVRMSAYVLGALPAVTMGALLLLRPDYVAPLFHDQRGKYILGAAAMLLLLAFLTMRQMVRKVTAA